MNKKNILLDVPSYEKFKKLDFSELEKLSFTLRKKLIDLANEKSIHLSSNLGIVEISMILLYLFNSPKDKIIYDIGHQCYVHKMLTNRYYEMNSIKDYEGISGFQEPNESDHDFVSLGHAGNAISISYGAAIMDKSNYYIPVIGDSSISNGVAFEALNDIGFSKKKIIVILNDNGMSISENVGQIHKILNKNKFRFSRNNFDNKFKKIPNKVLFRNAKQFFKLLGFSYIGPVDGHNLYDLLNSIKKAKKISHNKPVLVHIKTIKGFGLKESINDRIGEYHSIKLNSKKNDNYKSYSKTATDILINFASKDKNVYVMNSAMTLSSELIEFQKKFPNLYEDLGISEEHMISKAAGATINGCKIFISIYSTFLQRGFDNIIHDVSRNKLPITFLVDRSGISYNDGDTHHGIYDVSFIKTTMNHIITCPSNKYELEELMKMSLINKENPFYIRIPKEKCLDFEKNIPFSFGEWIWVQKKLGVKKCLITYGQHVNDFNEVISSTHDIDLINALFITSYNLDLVISVLKKYKQIFVVEPIIDNGCLANDLINIAYEKNISCRIFKFNIRHTNIGFGNKKIIDKKLGLDVEYILNKIQKS